jgi:hypothetical protein
MHRTPTSAIPMTRAQVFAEERDVLVTGESAGEPLAALCLSGGGIRSATFALGVLEVLARFEVLGEFHYLSTVSGGGYIGSWLTAWRAHQKNDQEVFAALDRYKSRDGKEAPQVQGLRFNSNYLTPKLGILSADTWAALALILRNIVLNWLVFGPLFLGVLFLPKVAASLLELLGPGSGATPGPWLLAGAFAATIGLATTVGSRLQAEGGWLKDGRFLGLVMVPLVVAAVAVTFGANARPQATTLPSALSEAAAGLGCYALAWCIGFSVWRSAASPATRKRTGVIWYWDFLAFAAAGLVAGILLGLGLHLSTLFAPGTAALLVFGPAWALTTFAVADLVFVGLNSFAARGEQDREWLARYGGWLLASGATFGVVCAIDLYMPSAMRWTWGRGTAYAASLGVSGAVTLLLGPSSLTGATTSRKAAEPFKLSTVVSVAALVFAVCLAGALSALDDQLICMVAAVDATRSAASACTMLDRQRAALYQIIVFAALIFLAFAASYFVNVNRFSLHALYRNRLVRAFLGAARSGATSGRHPDPFSGFDPDDNLHMAATLPVPGPGGVRLLHVVNMALNVVATTNLAWQERKAEPFTVTALHAGNLNVGYRPARLFGDPHKGITLGTAMAISGAAVSPNEGYHSSPLVGMLLSLFNLRLGWWLGNPRGGAFHQAGPVPGLRPALDELAGRTNDQGKWIYLSDGGHFDNLGLYEMVSRGCRKIVVSDAGCDPGSTFEDLGNAVRKIYIDMGVSIDFKTLDIPPRKNPPEPGFYCAVGTIRYPGDGGDGWLLYIKPGYRGVEPAHVHSYASANQTFPHESTTDQWFSESQFEAYRALGAYITELVCTGGSGIAPGGHAAKLDLDGLMTQARCYLNRKS